jgi:hypothetical protein
VEGNAEIEMKEKKIKSSSIRGSKRKCVDESWERCDLRLVHGREYVVEEEERFKWEGKAFCLVLPRR